jgi:hypothetical protein
MNITYWPSLTLDAVVWVPLLLLGTIGTAVGIAQLLNGRYGKT